MLKNQPNYKQRKKTKTQLKDALVRLLLKNDYMNISVNDICREADLSRGAFYTYYSSANALLREIEDEVLEGFLMEAKLMDDPQFLSQTEEKQIETIKKYLNYSYMVKDRLKVLLSGNAGVYFSNKLIHFYKKRYQEMNKTTGKTDDVKVDFCVGGVFNIVREWALNDIDDTPENIERLVRTISFLLKTEFSILYS